MRRNGWCLEPFFQPEVRGVERYLDGETADRKRIRHFHEPRQQFASLPRVMAAPRGTVKQRPNCTGKASGTQRMAVTNGQFVVRAADPTKPCLWYEQRTLGRLLESVAPRSD